MSLKPIINKKLYKYLSLSEIETYIQTNVLTGVKLNSMFLCGTKNKIEANETLTIPEHYEYNSFILDIEGIVDCTGSINIL